MVNPGKPTKSRIKPDLQETHSCSEVGSYVSERSRIYYATVPGCTFHLTSAPKHD